MATVIPARDAANSPLRWIATGLCLLAGLAVLGFALSAALPPSHRLTMAASSRWPVLAPRVVLVAAAALSVALLHGVRRMRITAIAVTALALVVSAGFTARMMLAVSNAGGTVNPVRALVFTSMDYKPDAVGTYTEPGLSATVYRPVRDRAPVIVYIHGGGWISGSATDLGHDMHWFADHGCAQRARAAGVDVTLVRIPYANHAFDQTAAGSLGNQAGLTIRQHYLAAHGLAP